jgi:hypothetical protein
MTRFRYESMYVCGTDISIGEPPRQATVSLKFPLLQDGFRHVPSNQPASLRHEART